MIVIIIVIAAFARRAKELGYSQFAWGVAGLGSYYIPQLIVGLLLGAYLVMEGTALDSSLEMGLNFLGIIPGALVAYYVYNKMPTWGKAKHQDDDLLDDNEFLGRT